MSIDDELLTAIKNCDLVKVKEAIANGANVNKKSYHVNIPLINYALVSNIDILKCLIENGADPNITNSYGNDMFQSIYNGEWYDKDVSGKYSDFEPKLFKWFNEYDTQCFIIEKFPKSIFRFQHYNNLHPDVLIKYNHLFTAIELNLL